MSVLFSVEEKTAFLIRKTLFLLQGKGRGRVALWLMGEVGGWPGSCRLLRRWGGWETFTVRRPCSCADLSPPLCWALSLLDCVRWSTWKVALVGQLGIPHRQLDYNGHRWMTPATVRQPLDPQSPSRCLSPVVRMFFRTVGGYVKLSRMSRGSFSRRLREHRVYVRTPEGGNCSTKAPCYSAVRLHFAFFF